MTGSDSSWPRPAVAWYMVGVMMIAYILSFIDRVILGLLVGLAAGATALVVLTPPRLRAQASAIYLLTVNLIGIGLAPFITALITDRWYGSDLAVGKSVAWVTGAAALIASVLLLFARPLFRAEVAAIATADRLAGRSS